MKKITFILSLLGLSSIVANAQGPYSLPFQETFSTVVSGTAYDQTTLNEVLVTKGWVYAEPTPLLIAGPAKISFKTLAQGGSFMTPEIMVPNSGRALELNFYARMLLNDLGSTTADKKTNNLQRNFYAVIGNDTVFDNQKLGYDMENPQMQNFNRFMGTYIYEGASSIRIKFFSTNTYIGVWSGVGKVNADGMIFGNNAGNGTEILSRLDATDTIPAINIAYGENINLGTIDKLNNATGTTVAKTFALKGKNLRNLQTLVESPVDFNDDVSTTIKLPTKNYTPSLGSLNETVTANITVPSATGTYKEKVTVVTDGDRATNATNSSKRPTRTIWFIYTVVDTSTGLDAVSLGINIFAANGKININSSNTCDVQIFNASGAIVHSLNTINNAAIDLPKGLYIVRAGSIVSKIVL